MHVFESSQGGKFKHSLVSIAKGRRKAKVRAEKKEGGGQRQRQGVGVDGNAISIDCNATENEIMNTNASDGESAEHPRLKLLRQWQRKHSSVQPSQDIEIPVELVRAHAYIHVYADLHAFQFANTKTHSRAQSWLF